MAARTLSRLALVAGLATLGWSSAAGAQCGPGPHWPDPCGAGLDQLQTRAIVDIDVDLDCLPDVSLVLTGPTDVRRQAASDASTNFPGALGSGVDGHLDVIDTEIVAMSLASPGGVNLWAGQGPSPFSGQVLVPTLGTNVEQPANDFQVDSFFDVFFEINFAAVLLYNQAPLQVQSVLQAVPPNQFNAFNSGPVCVQLFDQPVGGNHLFNLTSVTHTPIDPVPSLTWRGMGAMALLVAAAGAAVLAGRRGRRSA